MEYIMGAYLLAMVYFTITWPDRGWNNIDCFKGKWR